MKKILAVALVCAIALTGCGVVHKRAAYAFGSSDVCVDGIKYLQFPSGATVKIDKNTDKPAHC